MNSTDKKFFNDIMQTTRMSNPGTGKSLFSRLLWFFGRIALFAIVGLVGFHAIKSSTNYQDTLTNLGSKSPAHAFVSSKLMSCMSELAQNSTDYCLARVITLAEAQGQPFFDDVKTASLEYSTLNKL